MRVLAHSRIPAVIRKEALQIVRDRRTLAVVLLQPVMMLFLYGYGVSSDVTNVPLGLVDWSHTGQSRDFIRSLTASGYFRLAYATDRYADLGRAIDDRAVDVGVVIPPDFSRRITRGDAAPIQVLVEGTNPTTSLTVTSYLQTIVGSYSAAQIQTLAQTRGLGSHPRGIPPLDLRLRVWFNEDLRSVVFIVPGLIVVILMTTSALLTSGAIARERERGTFEQLVASPIKPYELIVGKIITYTALSYINVALVVVIGVFWFGVPMRGSVLLLTVASGLFLMSSLGIGLLVSTVTPTQRTAQMIVQLLTNMPGLLLSGFYYPISSMPRSVQLITTLIPARYFMVVTRGIFLKGAGLAELWPDIALLAFFGILPLAASVIHFSKRL